VDGFVKSPAAAVRFNFVVAAHLVSGLHSSVFARLASGSFYKSIVPMTFYEIINIDFIDGYIAAVMDRMKITDIYSFDKKDISRIRELKRIEA
jgi:predicted nucleic acid-binding protein